MKPRSNKILIFVLLTCIMLAACSAGSKSTDNPPRNSPPPPEMVITQTITETQIPSLTPTQTPSPTPVFTVEPLESYLLNIPAPSLTGNLLGDPAEQPLRVVLPPSYRTSERRYPVVYYLPGYGGSAYLEDIFPPGLVAERMRSGRIGEMILVVANGWNHLGGSFYVNSSVTGNWEDFIVNDVVNYVDSNYRTIATAEARGITGHSMGGFGALNLAMRHPQVFSSVYIFSAGLFDPDGMKKTMMFRNDNRIKAFLEVRDQLAKLPREEAIRQMGKYESNISFTLAYGAAFSPNPDMAPPFVNFPYEPIDEELVRDRNLWKTWDYGLGRWNEKINQYKDNLLSLNGIVIDYGKNDELTWIPEGNRYVSEQLNVAGIPNLLIEHSDGHSDNLGARILDIMLPFFTEKLSFK